MSSDCNSYFIIDTKRDYVCIEEAPHRCVSVMIALGYWKRKITTRKKNSAATRGPENGSSSYMFPYMASHPSARVCTNKSNSKVNFENSCIY